MPLLSCSSHHRRDALALILLCSSWVCSVSGRFAEARVPVGRRRVHRGLVSAMPRRAAPPFHGLVPRDDARDLVIKVKYSDTLKRFNACVNGPHFDHNLAALRSKIARAFKFSPDAEFILTYTDEDGDVVMLDDDNDLHDAAISQKLNPLRINVQLKRSSAGAPQTKQQASNSRSPMSTALEDQLTQMKSAIDEALKFVPEQVPVALAKLSHDLHSKAASSAPSLAELLDQFTKLMTPESNMQPSSRPTDGSSVSSCDGPQALGNLKMNHESELITVSASQPSDMKNSKSSKALGLKSVLIEGAKARVEQASGYPSVEDPLISASSGGKKIDRKGNSDAQSKEKSHAQGMWKSVISSAMPPVATIAHGVPTLHSASAPSMCENAPRYELNPGNMPFRSNGNINGDLHSIFPPPPVPPYCPIPPLGANGKTNGDLNLSFPPPPAYNYNPFKLNTPSLVSPYGPYAEGLYSFGGSYRDLGDKYGSVPQRTLHRWIQCDCCGVTPITGPRYKSNVKDDYDLCSACFSHMGNEAEYTRIDRPSLVSESLRDANKIQRPHARLQRDKLECRFIKDITVPDGTVMTPSTPFTKIWRMRNNGSTMWPFGTHLIWVGGDQFARQSSVKLGISVDGFPVDQEIDVGVEFIAPAKTGRYISYWRLALPSGQKFGQRVWVLIQVEQPVQTSGNKQPDAINLNLPPEGNSTKWKPFIDMNVELTDLAYDYSGSTSTDRFARSLFHEAIKPRASEPVLSAVPSAPTAVEPVQVPITDPHTSSGPVSTSMPADVPSAPEAIPLPKPVSVPAPEAIPLPKPVNVPAPVPVPTFVGASAPATVLAPAPAPAPVRVPAPTVVSAPVLAPMHAPTPVGVPAAPSHDEIMNHMEEKLLRELEEMGFRQVDLNKEILRQNKYDLEQSVDDLCSLHEWDPHLAELHELGYDDTDINEVLAKDDGGSDIKRVAMGLLAREKYQ